MHDRRLPSSPLARRRCGIAGHLALAALLACSQALAGFTNEPAPRLKLDLLPSLRAVSVCTEAPTSFPVSYGVVLESQTYSAQMPLDMRLQAVPGGSLPTGAQISISDAGQATIDERTATRIRARGFSSDLQSALNSLTVSSPAAGSAVLVIEIGDRQNDTPGVRTEMRVLLSFLTGSESIDTSLCDAPPVLMPQDDDGVRADDDYTYVVAPRFTVASGAASVSLLRDGVVVASAPVVAGTAQLQDDGAAGFGLHRYQAQHGSRAPSAGRWIEIDRTPGPPAQVTLPGVDVGRVVASTGEGAIARVMDAESTPLNGVAVTFTLSPSSGGAVATFPGGATQATALSNAFGEAPSPQISTGTAAGTVRLRAETAGGIFAEGDLRIVAGPAVTIERISGEDQQTPVGASFAAPLVARVRDQYGNPSGGQTVRFIAPTSGPTATFGSTDVIQGLNVVSTADGLATLRPRAINGAGTYLITARLQALPAQQVTFAARNLRAAPASIQRLSAGDTLGWLPGAAVTPLPSVRVLDAKGLPLADIDVRFALVEGDGSISGASTVASTEGVATLGGWQLGPTPDRLHRVQVQVQGLAPIEFSARTRPEYDVAVTVDNGRSNVVALSQSNWTVTVSNAGPSTAELALAVDYDGLDPVDFVCLAAASSMCSTAGQSGSLAPLLLTVAAGESIVIDVRAQVTAPLAAQAGLGVGLVFEAHAFDSDAGNNTAIDSDVVMPHAVFFHGFE